MEIKTINDIFTICIPSSERLDYVYSSKFREELIPLINQTKYMLIDLSKQIYIDSSAIGLIVTARQKLKKEGGQLGLIIPAENEIVNRILSISGIPKVIPIYHTVDEAINDDMKFPKIN